MYCDLPREDQAAVRASAVTRVTLGESVSEVAREVGVSRKALQKWIAAAEVAAATAEVAPAPNLREQLQHDVALLLHESAATLIKHMRLYGSDAWITKQKPETLLEATRTVGSRYVAIVDRLGGRAPEHDSDD